jgi:5-methylcytosine-specific restriction protein A
MTKRLEFSAKVRDQAAQRANSKCEMCGLPFGGRRPEYDHVLPAALGGKPTLANCRAVCGPCHRAKTAKEDVPRIRKADRQRRAATGAHRPRPKIPSNPDALKAPPKVARIDKSALAPLPRRSIYRDM